MDVVIVETGGANLHSLAAALKRLGATARWSADPEEVRRAHHVILPGVGAAGEARRRLLSTGLVETLPRLTQPVLGICLGMQLFFKYLAEDDTVGLGLLPGSVLPLPTSPRHPVPHMGWSRLEIVSSDPLLKDLGKDPYVYFVHGYAASAGPETLATFVHGERYSAVVRIANFWGVQFHPERSADVGARILMNFLST